MANATIAGLTQGTKLNTADNFPYHPLLPVGSDIDQRVLWSDLMSSFLTTPPANLWGQIAKIEQAVSGAQAVFCYIGDSWTNDGSITRPLNNWLQTTYGNAGAGYVGIGMNHGTPDVALATYTRTGTWVDQDNAATSILGRGVDIADATSTDTATPAQVTIGSATFNIAVIHFLKQTNGGDFRYRIDGGSWTTVTTANAGDLYSTTTISGLTTATHTLDIQVLNAGTAGVTLFGVDLQRTGIGARLHRMGNPGANSTQYAAANVTLWEAGLTALAPTSVAIMLGTNDMSQSITPTAFGANLETIITRINATLPLVDVILTPPADNGLTGKPQQVAAFRDEMRNVAVRKGAFFIDTYAAMGSSYANGNARGLYANSSHPNNYGGWVISNAIIRALNPK